MSRQLRLRTRHGRAANNRNRVTLGCQQLEDRNAPDDGSAGPNGIDARSLGNPALTGAGIHIGQVEAVRPGDPDLDSKALFHPDVNPAAVYFRDGAAAKDKQVGSHAIKVAGILIANGPANKGVSPDASLHSAAIFDSVTVSRQITTLQHVARLNNDDVPAVNVSWGAPVPQEHKMLDGSNPLSQAVDYLGSKHDALYVLSSGNTGFAEPANALPKDSYNGLVVGGLTKQGDVYSRIWSGSFSPLGFQNRRLVNVVAPAAIENVPRNTPDEGDYKPEAGTSMAAPHVTGTVAILQQDARTKAGLGAAAQRHEVMKAVIMNSADKIKEVGGSKYPITKPDSGTWANSIARDTDDNQIGRIWPLDQQMGTGAVNTRRAVTQLEGGQFGPANPETKAIGWDYGTTAGLNQFTKYTLPTLKGGSTLTATLVWDRSMGFQIDKGTQGFYDPGDEFKTVNLANLDLYLVPVLDQNKQQVSDAVWSSISGTKYNGQTNASHNVEHIHRVLKSGDKKYECGCTARKATVPASRSRGGVRRVRNPRRRLQTRSRSRGWCGTTRTATDSRGRTRSGCRKSPST